MGMTESVDGAAGAGSAGEGTLNGAWARRWMADAAKALSENADELSDLDRRIGDGDHGANMDRGMKAVVEKLGGGAGGSGESVGDVLKTAAMTLMSTVGGAAGPLYGTAFLRMATALGAAPAVDGGQLAAGLEAARDGVVSRGKAESGDKTMIDAWTPAVEAAQTAAQAGASAAEVMAAAANAAVAGADATEPLVARKGRASYLGERSAGTRDPGAVSTGLILMAGADAAGTHVGETE
ncbi:dihydroxyacetone kinase subunit DhaL [Haematomicrobium sanguinis]|uniref:dihydroxyacetone kinase subunit DhaL n=1 Tax=Haematomicrobium sanguinis TaxID=479106 RepID=UPI001F0B344D|nr:dihydroxyacetone kinase subunit DhaL [Haematomicrobium sanguinis]